MPSTPPIAQLDLYSPSDDLLIHGVFTYGLFEDNIREAPERTALHRHDFHEIFILTTGSGIYSADFQDFTITSPSIVIVPSGTCHQWSDTEQLKGHALAFDLEFLGVRSRSSGTATLLRPPVLHVSPLNKETLDLLTPNISRIRGEWETDSPNRREAIRASLTLILLDLHRYLDQQQSIDLTPGSANSAGNNLYSDFLELLDQTWKTSPRPKDLAEMLRITPDHLSATLREIAGANTSDLISERIILEAKRLLAHSRLGIAEVAYSTGFEDPSYFARFFKRKTGATPKEFRKEFESAS